MYTQCAKCKAIFRVGMKDLTTAQGLLRCGECDTIFDAMETLSTTLPDSPFSELTRNIENLKPKTPAAATSNLIPSAVSAGAMQSSTAGVDEMQAAAAVAPTASTKPASALSSKSLPLKKKSKREGWNIGDLRTRKRPLKLEPATINLRKLLSILGVIVLLLLLLGQIWYKQRDWFVMQPWAESVTRTYCAAIGCTFAADRKVYVELVSLDIYSHPDKENMLYVGVTMANHLEEEQPYPKLEINFLDKDEKVAVKHLILPKEYLGYIDTPERMLAWNVPVSFNFALPDPGDKVASYTSKLKY